MERHDHLSSTWDHGLNTLLQVAINNYRILGFTSSTGIANFLGVPYASIPARFKSAQPLEPLNISGVHDATRYGPRCPQPIDIPRTKRQHLFEGTQQSDSLPVSEFDCLNLNIYAPAKRSTKLLPVFIWVHGGGFVVGDGGPEYDGNFLVEYAMKLGKPFVFVGINYRLGHFGFLNANELRAEAVADAHPPLSNIGLHDQRLAFLWIQNNIHHFGGDKSNITIAGESAGAWSVLAHLRSSRPVCRQAVIMSTPSLAPLTLYAAQRNFDHLVTLAGIDPMASGSKKLARLRCLSSEDLTRLGDQSLIIPCWDSAWFSHSNPSLPLEEAGAFPSWLDSILLSWTEQEFALFGITDGLQKWSVDSLIHAVHRAIPSCEFATEVMDMYGITPTAPQRLCFEALCRLGTDGLFGSVPHHIISAAVQSPPSSDKTNVYIYRFDHPDSYPTSAFRGYAYHALDNAFTCRLPAVAGNQAPACCRATADTLSSGLLEFMHGRKPWEQGDVGMLYSVNGNASGLVPWNSEESIWKRLATTREREEMIRGGARALLGMERERE